VSVNTKTNTGNFFEDFKIGQQIRHATPRTVTLGDVALYNGLFGARFAVQSSDTFAAALGYPRSPIDRTSRSTPSPISAMPTVIFSNRSIPATRSTPYPKSSA
jgi:hypothetical protein